MTGHFCFYRRNEVIDVKGLSFKWGVVFGAMVLLILLFLLSKYGGLHFF